MIKPTLVDPVAAWESLPVAVRRHAIDVAVAALASAKKPAEMPENVWINVRTACRSLSAQIEQLEGR